jgi:hypothetical protein
VKYKQVEKLHGPRFLEAVPTKKERNKNVINVLSQRRTLHYSKHIFQEPIQPIQKKFHDPKVLRSRSYKKKEKKNVSNVISQRRTHPIQTYLSRADLKEIP